MRLLIILCIITLLITHVLAGHNLPNKPPYNCTTVYSGNNSTLHDEMNCSATMINETTVNISFTDDFSPKNTTGPCNIKGENLICKNTCYTRDGVRICKPPAPFVHGENGQPLRITLLGTDGDDNEDYKQGLLAAVAVVFTGLAYYIYSRMD